MDIFAISAVCVIISAVSLVLKKDYKELSICISIVGVIIIISVIIKNSFPIIEQVKKLSNLANINNETLSIMLKACGICFVSGIASQICKDIGEESFSIHIETTARIIILLLCLPLMKTVITELFKFTEV